MVTGVNSNYYNYYNNYQNPNGNYNQISGVIPNSSGIIPQGTVNPKTSEDGKDDGSISFGSMMKNLGIGALKFVTGMFTDENGNLSLWQTLKTAAIAVGIGAVCVLTAGTAVPAILATAGIAVSGFGVGKAVVNAALADTDAEAEQAWQSLGSNGVALGLSIVGAKSVAKSTHAAEAAAGKFDGARGLWESVKTVTYDASRPLVNSFAGVKDAYTGATTMEKLLSSAAKVKDNVVSQYGEFTHTVRGNYEHTIYGISNKIENETAALDKEKAAIESKMEKITDKTSKKYKTLENKVKTIEAKQAAAREINSTTSWEEANEKIAQNRASLTDKKSDLQTATTDAQKANLKAEISELETKIKTQESVLSRRTAEVKAIDKRIETLTEKANKSDVSAAQKAQYQAKIDALNSQKTAANFELPQKPATEVSFKDLAESKYDYAKAELKNQISQKNPRADQNTQLANKTNATNAKARYETVRNTYRQQQAANPGGIKTQASNEIVNSAISSLKDPASPSRWLTVGVAGRQFGETADVRFYNELSPQEQKYFKNLPYKQKQAIIDAYTQLS